MQEKRIALLGIIVENKSATAEINRLLHECGEYIVGRLGIPYRERKISIISVVLDAP
jgi:putative iron-only hydrogenase system regulator